jgi:hypothetical protein
MAYRNEVHPIFAKKYGKIRVPYGKFNRVKMNVSIQFLQINILLTNDGLIPGLK